MLDWLGMKLLNVFVFSLQETKEKHTKQKPTVGAALGAVLGVGFGGQEAAAWSAHINDTVPRQAAFVSHTVPALQVA